MDNVSKASHARTICCAELKVMRKKLSKMGWWLLLIIPSYLLGTFILHAGDDKALGLAILMSLGVVTMVAYWRMLGLEVKIKRKRIQIAELEGYITGHRDGRK